MSDIFISYRRGAASPYARGIYERLEKQFGADRVFMDIDTMEPGVDFVEYIQRAVSSCRVLIVLIGPDWVTTVDDTGKRRLDDPEDFVRVEVMAAFQRDDVRVIPVLVGDATPPKKADLPPELAPLTRRQALEITDGRWDYDLSVLTKTIRRVLDAEAVEREPVERQAERGDGEQRAGAPVERGPTDRAEPRARPRATSWLTRPAGLTIAVLLLALIVVVVIVFSSGSGEEGGANSAPVSQESAAIPTADRCRPAEDTWMIEEIGADQQLECRLETSARDLKLPYLTYGVFASAAEARKQLTAALQREDEEGGTRCPESASSRMQDALGQGKIACFVDGHKDYIQMWWNEDRSPFFGSLHFAASTSPEVAVDAWERVFSAQ
jgi:hypothetical protein